jgi:hypothetical protein
MVLDLAFEQEGGGCIVNENHAIVVAADGVAPKAGRVVRITPVNRII